MESFQYENEFRVHVYDTGPDDTYDIDFVMKNFPQSAEINYLSESLFNEEIFC